MKSQSTTRQANLMQDKGDVVVLFLKAPARGFPMFSDRTKFHSSPHPHNISCIFCITIITYMKFMHITFIIYINRQSSTKTSINFMCITHILYIMLCTQDLLQSSSITGVLTQESFSQECFHRSCYTGFLRELLHRNCHTGVSF